MHLGEQGHCPRGQPCSSLVASYRVNLSTEDATTALVCSRARVYLNMSRAKKEAASEGKVPAQQKEVAGIPIRNGTTRDV